MLRAVRTKELTCRACLTDFARAESKAFVPSQALRMWELYEGAKLVGVVGITRGSFIGTGTVVWFGAGKDLARMRQSSWRALRRTLRRLAKLFGHLRAYVQCDFEQGRRLLRFFGFRETAVTHNLKVFELWHSLEY